jgi:hypothetical protein
LYARKLERLVAQSGNGIDLGAVYRLLTEVAETVRAHGERFDIIDRRMDQLLRVVNEHTRVLDEHGRQLTELRGAVDQFHEAVVSQGIHYSGLEDRVRRVERHLKLEPSGE